MAGKLRNRRNKTKKPRFWLLLLLALLIFAAGYGVTACGLSERAVDTFKSWFGGEEPVLSPPDSDEDPEPEPDPDPEQPDEKPGEPVDEAPEEPVIYTGQVLLIPAAEGGGGGSASLLIQSGTLAAANKQIALTFDSGWLYEQTIPLLNVLDQYNVTATFFPRALWVKDHPELGREIVGRGHSMGNHSLTHPHMREMTDEQIRHEMRESTRIIQEVTGVRPFMFRPPYGEYNQRVLEILAEESYPYTIMWTVDTLDWAAGTTRTIGGKEVEIDVDFIVNRVLNNATDNGIVLMHIGGASTVEALPQIIEGLRDMGYGFATVDEMLPAPGSGTITHTVKSGDTLYSIAQKYGVSLQQIIEVNNLN